MRFFSLIVRSIRIARAEREFIAARAALQSRASLDAMLRFADASSARYVAIFGGRLSDGAPNISPAMRHALEAR